VHESFILFLCSTSPLRARYSIARPLQDMHSFRGLYARINHLLSLPPPPLPAVPTLLLYYYTTSPVNPIWAWVLLDLTSAGEVQYGLALTRYSFISRVLCTNQSHSFFAQPHLCGRSTIWLGLYKRFIHFEAFVHESIYAVQI